MSSSKCEQDPITCKCKYHNTKRRNQKLYAKRKKAAEELGLNVSKVQSYKRFAAFTSNKPVKNPFISMEERIKNLETNQEVQLLIVKRQQEQIQILQLQVQQLLQAQQNFEPSEKKKESKKKKEPKKKIIIEKQSDSEETEEESEREFVELKVREKPKPKTKAEIKKLEFEELKLDWLERIQKKHLKENNQIIVQTDFFDTDPLDLEGVKEFTKCVKSFEHVYCHRIEDKDKRYDPRELYDCKEWSGVMQKFYDMFINNIYEWKSSKELNAMCNSDQMGWRNELRFRALFLQGMDEGWYKPIIKGQTRVY